MYTLRIILYMHMCTAYTSVYIHVYTIHYATHVHVYIMHISVYTCVHNTLYYTCICIQHTHMCIYMRTQYTILYMYTCTLCTMHISAHICVQYTHQCIYMCTVIHINVYIHVCTIQMPELLLITYRHLHSLPTPGIVYCTGHTMSQYKHMLITCMARVTVTVATPITTNKCHNINTTCCCC